MDHLMDNEFKWYMEEFNRVYGSQTLIVNHQNANQACPDFRDAITSTLNEGLPLGLISAEDIIKTLNDNLCN